MLVCSYSIVHLFFPLLFLESMFPRGWVIVIHGECSNKEQCERNHFTLPIALSMCPVLGGCMVAELLKVRSFLSCYEASTVFKASFVSYLQLLRDWSIKLGRPHLSLRFTEREGGERAAYAGRANCVGSWRGAQAPCLIWVIEKIFIAVTILVSGPFVIEQTKAKALQERIYLKRASREDQASSIKVHMGKRKPVEWKRQDKQFSA